MSLWYLLPLFWRSSVSVLSYKFSITGLNYQDSTAFVITFLVNNHLKDEDNEKAMAWEKVLIDFMKTRQNGPNMTIAFNTEVGLWYIVFCQGHSTTCGSQIIQLQQLLYDQFSHQNKISNNNSNSQRNVKFPFKTKMV